MIISMTNKARTYYEYSMNWSKGKLKTQDSNNGTVIQHRGGIITNGAK